MDGLMFSVIVIFSQFLFTVGVFGTVRLKPVVLVPGLFGSGLYATLDNALIPSCSSKPLTEKTPYRVWLSLSKFLPRRQKCLLDTLRLEYQDGVFSSVPGVTITVQGQETSTLDGFDYLDYIEGEGMPKSEYFHYLIKALKDKGYKEGQNLAGRAYDWRLPVRQIVGTPNLSKWAQETIQTIQTLYNNNQNQPVVILAHSLGTLVINYFLNLAVSAGWKQKYIDSFMPVGSVYGGSFEAVQSLYSGYDSILSFHIFNLDIELIDLKMLRDLQRDLGSMYDMVPFAETVGEDHVVIKQALDSEESPKKYETYTMRNWMTLLPPESQEKLLFAHKYHASVLADPQVRVSCIWSSGDNPNTARMFQYDSLDLTKQPKVFLGYGDHTVPIESLTYCKRWKSTKATKEFRNVYHMAMFGSLEFHDYVLNELTVGDLTYTEL